MKLLLDTNALVWTADPKRVHNLGKNTRRVIEKSDVVFFSPISIAELQIKHMAGKYKHLPDIATGSQDSGLVELPFSSAHAEALSNFPSLARHDPFDRMLLAQAQTEGLTLLTSDSILLGFNLTYIVDATE